MPKDLRKNNPFYYQHVKKQSYYYNAPDNSNKTAKYLRKRATPAEKLLWTFLRRGYLNGFKFRRQHPIEFYFADFYCHKAKLVIELDGPIHERNSSIEWDINRTAVMGNHEITVLRFKNQEVFENIENVLKQILEYLQSIE